MGWECLSSSARLLFDCSTALLANLELSQQSIEGAVNHGSSRNHNPGPKSSPLRSEGCLTPSTRTSTRIHTFQLLSRRRNCSRSELKPWLSLLFCPRLCRFWVCAPLFTNLWLITMPSRPQMAPSAAKPIVVLYGTGAPLKERLFTRGLVNTLKSAGLDGKIWFDWDESLFDPERRQIRR